MTLVKRKKPRVVKKHVVHHRPKKPKKPKIKKPRKLRAPHAPKVKKIKPIKVKVTKVKAPPKPKIAKVHTVSHAKHHTAAAREQESPVTTAHGDTAVTDKRKGTTMGKTLIEKVTEQRDRQLSIAATCMAEAGNEPMDSATYDRYNSAMRKAETFEKQRRTVEKAARKEARAERTPKVKVKSEPRMYHLHGEFSYFVDLAADAGRRTYGSLDDEQVRLAQARLDRHATEVRGEIAMRSPEGLRAERVMRARTEARAMSTVITSGGSFVTPDYLIEEWAPFNAPVDSFTRQTRHLPLPAYGLEVHVPSFTSALTAAVQSPENTGVSDTTPTGADLDIADSVPIKTFAGEVPISQQLFDRGGSNQAGSMDMIIAKQASQQLATAVDNYVIAQAIATAGTVSERYDPDDPAAVGQRVLGRRATGGHEGHKAAWHARVLDHRRSALDDEAGRHGQPTDRCSRRCGDSDDEGGPEHRRCRCYRHHHARHASVVHGRDDPGADRPADVCAGHRGTHARDPVMDR